MGNTAMTLFLKSMEATTVFCNEDNKSSLVILQNVGISRINKINTFLAKLSE